jgi:hypothetical protein
MPLATSCCVCVNPLWAKTANFAGNCAQARHVRNLPFSIPSLLAVAFTAVRIRQVTTKPRLISLPTKSLRVHRSGCVTEDGNQVARVSRRLGSVSGSDCRGFVRPALSTSERSTGCGRRQNPRYHHSLVCNSNPPPFATAKNPLAAPFVQPREFPILKRTASHRRSMSASRGELLNCQTERPVFCSVTTLCELEPGGPA